MLIRFSVANYLSFAEETTIDMTPTNITEHKDSHIYKTDSADELLKGAVFYGPNASGKSNLLKALNFLKRRVIYSVDSNRLIVDKFAFDTKYLSKPAYFEIEILIKKTVYRFGFKLDTDKVVQEWLYAKREGKNKEDKIALYTRDGADIHCSKDFKNAEQLINQTRPDALFLTVCAKFNVAIAMEIVAWFDKVLLYVGPNDFSMSKYDSMIDNMNPAFKRALDDILKIADTQIEATVFKKNNDSDNNILKLLGRASRNNIYTLHKKYSEGELINGEMAELAFEQESEGTKKFFGMLLYLLSAYFNNKVLLIDELDSKIHTLLAKKIAFLFFRTESQMQLIFNTHDVNLLSDKQLFRRDEIWFTQKNKYGMTEVFSLAEYKVRNDASYGKDYLAGKYGGVPKIGDFDEVINNVGGSK